MLAPASLRIVLAALVVLAVLSSCGCAVASPADRPASNSADTASNPSASEGTVVHPNLAATYSRNYKLIPRRFNIFWPQRAGTSMMKKRSLLFPDIFSPLPTPFSLSPITRAIRQSEADTSKLRVLALSLPSADADSRLPAAVVIKSSRPRAASSPTANLREVGIVRKSVPLRCGSNGVCRQSTTTTGRFVAPDGTSFGKFMLSSSVAYSKSSSSDTAPSKPEKPEKPSKPSEPSKPSKPSKPSDPNDNDDSDDDEPRSSNVDKEDGDSQSNGDNKDSDNDNDNDDS